MKIFKWRGKKLFVCKTRPRPIDPNIVLSDSIQRIVDAVQAQPGIKVSEMVTSLAPRRKEVEAPKEGEFTPAERLVLTDLHWLIDEGYIIEFASSGLFLGGKLQRKKAVVSKEKPKEKTAKTPEGASASKPTPDQPKSDSDEAQPASGPANNASEQAQPTSGQANNDSDQAQTAPEQANNDSDQAQTAPEQANNDSEHAQPASEQANNDSDQAQPTSEQANNDSDQAQTAPEQANNDSEQAQPASEQANNDSDQATSDSDEVPSEPNASDAAEALPVQPVVRD